MKRAEYLTFDEMLKFGEKVGEFGRWIKLKDNPNIDYKGELGSTIWLHKKDSIHSIMVLNLEGVVLGFYEGYNTKLKELYNEVVDYIKSEQSISVENDLQGIRKLIK